MLWGYIQSSLIVAYTKCLFTVLYACKWITAKRISCLFVHKVVIVWSLYLRFIWNMVPPQDMSSLSQAQWDTKTAADVWKRWMERRSSSIIYYYPVFNNKDFFCWHFTTLLTFSNIYKKIFQFLLYIVSFKKPNQKNEQIICFPFAIIASHFTVTMQLM